MKQALKRYIYACLRTLRSPEDEESHRLAIFSFLLPVIFLIGFIVLLILTWFVSGFDFAIKFLITIAGWYIVGAVIYFALAGYNIRDEDEMQAGAAMMYFLPWFLTAMWVCNLKVVTTAALLISMSLMGIEIKIPDDYFESTHHFYGGKYD